MQRRTLMKAAASTLAAPATLRAQSATTLRFTPQQDLVTLDPVTTTAYVSRNHGYMVFDTLYGMDGSFQATPQMVDGHTIEDDGKLWNLTLRDGLRWHDGERVLARDCVASIRRWAQRDPFGTTLMETTDELSAPDDKTIRFRLKRPFPLLPLALGKASVPVCAMMPERLANTDPFRQVPEMIGSGPFRFKADERVPGARVVYTKLDGYVPRRDGVLSWTSGPKVVHFDRVEWTVMPDSATATNALIAGEQDWQEYAYHDLLAPLRRSRNVQVRLMDPTGFVGMVRMNHLTSPFNNPELPPGAVGCHRPDRDHAGAGRPRREQPLPRAAWLLRARHADGLRCRAGAAAGAARLRPREGGGARLRLSWGAGAADGRLNVATHLADGGGGRGPVQEGGAERRGLLGRVQLHAAAAQPARAG
ncbi:MAG: extracellular solute-binding protein family 5, partial [Rhodospirillales bacterium]|nr:extracellular solute-binding protein family 5 [Rhodospirillales bacterium]